MNAPDRSGGAQPEYWEPVEPDIPALRSAARELGNPAQLDPDQPIDPDPPRPATMLELDRYDQIVSFGTLEPPCRRRPLGNVRHEHVLVCKWLDRFGFMTTDQLRRAVLPDATLRARRTCCAACETPASSNAAASSSRSRRAADAAAAPHACTR